MPLPPDMDEDDLMDARDTLESFCDAVDGEFGHEYFNTNEQYACSFDNGRIALTSAEGVDVEEMTGRMEIPEDWNLKAEITGGEVDMLKGVIEADTLQFRGESAIRSGPTLELLRNGVDVGRFRG